MLADAENALKDSGALLKASAGVERLGSQFEPADIASNYAKDLICFALGLAR